jgi:hypothetical protein
MTATRIESALAYVAACIAAHGDAYLPLFERLEAELLAVRTKESARDRALRLARAA